MYSGLKHSPSLHRWEVKGFCRWRGPWQIRARIQQKFHHATDLTQEIWGERWGGEVAKGCLWAETRERQRGGCDGREVLKQMHVTLGGWWWHDCWTWVEKHLFHQVPSLPFVYFKQSGNREGCWWGRIRGTMLFRLLPSVLGCQHLWGPKKAGMLAKSWKSRVFHLLSRLCRTIWS